MSQPKFYIPSLDGIRAIAFLIVFLSHAGLNYIIPGGFGVTIFFFLSGYLITTLLRKEYEHYQTINIQSFYLRRILRIWPVFYLVLILGTILTLLGFFKGQIYLHGFLSQFFHYSNYYSIVAHTEGIAMGSGVYWSLAVDEHFYLLFPLFYLFLRRMNVSPRRQAIIFWLLCLVVLIWRCVLVFSLGASPDRIFFASDTRIDMFLYGCALGVIHNPMLDQQYASEKLWKYLFLPLGIMGILFSMMYRPPEFRETFRYTIQALSLYPIFITAIRFPNFGFFQFLNLRWVRFIGLVSYSLYLVHHTVILAIQMYLPNLPMILQGIVSILASFIISCILYYFIESPIAKLRKKFSRS
ncbi:MAG TPA: acyltransferase [Nostocaceae cyanobacterium]|nr:acyltransferase [Nostocaceae cyanobacterium]